MNAKQAIAMSLAGALAIGAATPSWAAPVTTNTAAVKAAAPDNTVDVRWRGRGFGPGIAFGLATGALVGAAVASRPYYGPGYYGGDYGGPAYYGGYYGGPAYYAEPVYEPVVPVYPSYGYRYRGYGWGGCYTDEGYGRYQPCER